MQTPKRWYDEDPVIFTAIQTWQGFPLALQLFIANYILRELQHLNRAEPEASPDEDAFMVTSRQLITLYLTGQKRRWLDDNPTVHSAMNTLALADRERQLDIAQRILRVKAYFDEHAIADEDLTEDRVTVILGDVMDELASGKA